MTNPNTIGLLDLVNKEKIEKGVFIGEKEKENSKDSAEKEMNNMKNVINSLEKMCMGNSPELPYAASEGSIHSEILPTKRSRRPRHKKKYSSGSDSDSDSGESDSGNSVSSHSSDASSVYSDRYKPIKKSPSESQRNEEITLADIQRNHRGNERYRSNREIRETIDTLINKETVEDPRLEYSKKLKLTNATNKSDKINRAKYLYEIMKSDKVCLDGIEYPSPDLDDETIDEILDYLEYKNDVSRGSELVEEGIQCVADLLVSVCDGSFKIMGSPIDLTGWDKKVQAKLGRMKYATSEVSTSIVNTFKLKGIVRILVELLPSGFLQMKQNNRNRQEKGLNFDHAFQSSINNLNDDSDLSSLGSDDESDDDSDLSGSESDYDSEV